MKSICGVDCSACASNNTCKGCSATNGQPFGAECLTAKYCQKGQTALNEFKLKLIKAFNDLNIEDMEKVTSLNSLIGSFVNIKYTLPSGQIIKLWDDNKIYFGNQLQKKGSDRCYGITADEKYLAVVEYGNLGCDAEIVIFKRWQ